MADEAGGGPMAPQAARSTSGRAFACAAAVVGVVTSVMAAAVAFCRAPAGIFASHELPYYGTAACAFVAGVAEAWVAATIWFSRDPGRHRSAGRCVLYASFLPLLVVVGLGGVHALISS